MKNTIYKPAISAALSLSLILSVMAVSAHADERYTPTGGPIAGTADYPIQTIVSNAFKRSKKSGSTSITLNILKYKLSKGAIRALLSIGVRSAWSGGVRPAITYKGNENTIDVRFIYLGKKLVKRDIKIK